jgi:hypothetical protein
MAQLYYYLYLIKFNDGRYYIGSRKCECKPEEDTGYMGSPVTFKELWADSNLSKTKYILREVHSVEELKRIEPKLIKEAWKRDGKDVCLNRHASPTFHPDVCVKGGKIGGKISGKKALELRIGIHAQTPEQKIEYGKIGGKIIAERTAREFTLVSPTGEVIHGRNLREFVKENNLDRRCIQKVLNGKYKHHKGYMRYNDN